MKISECNHIRIRDNNAYGIDVETIIKYIETTFDIDIRTLPQWKEILQRLHVSTTDCKRIIQDAKRRKAQIINKLYKQSTRLSPFELTDILARTASRWEMLKGERRRKKIPFILEPEIIPVSNMSERSFAEQSELESGHPNTEESKTNLEFIDATTQKSEVETDTQTMMSHLPIHINTNPHELVGPKYSGAYFGDRSQENDEILSTCSEKDLQEWIILPESTLVKSSPKEIIITNESLEEQVVKFSITNCGTEYVHVRFVCVTEKSPFRYAKIIPKTPTKLYPGLSKIYKLIFKVVQNEQDFASCLYFRIGQIVLAEGSKLNSLRIPVKSNYLKPRKVSVSQAAYLPSVYPWHLGGVCGYPTSYVKISILDDFSYNVHVIKKTLDLLDEPSMQSSLNDSSTEKPTSEELIATQSKGVQSQDDVIEVVDSVDVISPILNDIVETSLDSVWLEYTFLSLQKHSSYSIPVHLTKVERIGSHLACYDVEFFDSVTDKHIFTKTVKIYGQILAHPIQIHPLVLDMTQSPITHGFCEDKFVVVNTHKFYPVAVKIKLTTKMKKILHIYPMEVEIPTTSNVQFNVSFCSPGLASSSFEHLVHFTIKIIVTGHESVYYNVPPFFYEIIAPCITEYKKVYSKKAEAEFAEVEEIRMSI